MICPKCNIKALVTNSFCMDNYTYRIYTCPKCKNHLYTTECEDYPETVTKALYQKRVGYRNGSRKRI